MSSSLESAIARRRPAAGRPAGHPYTILPLALAVLVGVVAGNALAQGSAPAKGSGEPIAAVTRRVDGGFYLPAQNVPLNLMDIQGTADAIRPKK